MSRVSTVGICSWGYPFDWITKRILGAAFLSELKSSMLNGSVSKSRIAASMLSPNSNVPSAWFLLRATKTVCPAAIRKKSLTAPQNFGSELITNIVILFMCYSFFICLPEMERTSPWIAPKWGYLSSLFVVCSGELSIYMIAYST